jgi:hypothetical protein
MSFQINALDHKPFQDMFHLNKNELYEIGGIKMTVNEHPGFPCRVSLEDANIGEEVILIPFEHHKTNSPYQAKGPIFVRKGVQKKAFEINEIPKMLEHRLLSFRGYDKLGIMKSAITEEGKETKTTIERIFRNDSIAYIHIHNASPGCFNCEVQRVN